MTDAAVEVAPHRPFVGLRPFGYDDNPVFHGRRGQINALYQLVDASRFVAVIGSSGSGKSSLVRAGLLPLLDKESADPDAGRVWVWRVMQPGDAPLDELIATLAGLCRAGSADALAERRARIDYHIRRSSYGMADALREIDELRGKTLLLVVDQFEELFRFSSQARHALASLEGGSPAVERLRAEVRKEEVARDVATQFVQILLEADRNPTLSVHVLITMRSDFIGDCARYHDLPEAVSASQFLVPGLKRRQLEEVIRKPAEALGASVDPELLERLLLDSDDENDQLPVLEHCLMRIWDRANERRSPPKHLTIDDYVAVGRLDRALSQHADELMDKLPGLEVAVEMTFRALAELDREGRAIRRALPYHQLREETGVSEAQLSQVLERFRADGCSFLVPAPSATPILGPNSRIDVGHEALLRRWDKINGVAGAADEAEARGWLRSEARDRQHYVSLLGWLDNQRNGGEGVPLNLVEREVRWWSERPRTSAWAERYGGQFEAVETLLRSGKEALRRAAQNKRAAKRTRLLLLGIGVLAAVFVLRLVLNERQQRLSNQDTLGALADAQDEITQKIVDAGNVGDLKTKGAIAMLAIEAKVLDKYRHIPNYQSLLAKLKLASSDIYQHARNFEKALTEAQLGEEDARDLIVSDPNNGGWRQLDYAAWARISEIRHQTIGPGAKETRDAYDHAKSAIEKALDLEPDNLDWRMDEAFLLGHMGLVLGSPQGDELLQQSVDKMRALTRLDPTRPVFRRELANAVQRVGRVRLANANGDKNLLEEAAASFDEAMLIRQALQKEDPGNDIYASNLISNYTDFARVAEARGKFDAAQQDLRTVIQRQTALAKKDAGNAQWLVYLASDLALMIDFLGDECRKGCDSERKSVVTKEIRQNFVREIFFRQTVAARPGAGDSELKSLDERVRKLIDYIKSLEGAVLSDGEVAAMLATCRFPVGAAAAPGADNADDLLPSSAAAPFASAPDDLFALARLDIDAVDAIPKPNSGAADVRACFEHSVDVLNGADAKTKADPRWAPLHDEAMARLAALEATRTAPK